MQGSSILHGADSLASKAIESASLALEGIKLHVFVITSIQKICRMYCDRIMLVWESYDCDGTLHEHKSDDQL
jgi:hypothetical protein